MTTTLTLPLPPTANKMYRISGKRLVLTEAASNYKVDAGWTAVQAGVTPLTGNLWLCLNFYTRSRRSDADNGLKVLIDSLNGIAWEDDRQIVELHVYLYEDKDNPRVEVSISQIAGRTK